MRQSKRRGENAAELQRVVKAARGKGLVLPRPLACRFRIGGVPGKERSNGHSLLPTGSQTRTRGIRGAAAGERAEDRHGARASGVAPHVHRAEHVGAAGEEGFAVCVRGGG